MTGKDKCKILKEIRAQIARENDINLVIEECTHKGKCRGTCPRCESEVVYLERELEKRRQAQKRVALAGISAGMTVALAGCSALEDTVTAVWDKITGHDQPEIIEQLDGEVELMGDVPYYDPDDDPEVVGKMTVPDDLEGDVAPQEPDEGGE